MTDHKSVWWKPAGGGVAGPQPEAQTADLESRYRRLMAEANHDSGGKVDLSTQKLDAGKAPVFQGLASYFPRALVAVAEVSAFGQQKYGEWGGWVKVKDGSCRYADALLRHFFSRAGGEEFDQESKLRHAAQAAWNALAVLELELRDREPAK